MTDNEKLRRRVITFWRSVLRKGKPSERSSSEISYNDKRNMADGHREQKKE